MKSSHHSKLHRLLCLVEDYVLDGYRHDHAEISTRLPAKREVSKPEVAAGAVDSGAARAGAPAAKPGSGPAPEARAAAPAPEARASDAELEALAGEIRSCRLCELHKRRTQAVPGEGTSRPRVLVVGEGPGFEEDRSGRPFVGPAGRYLDKWLQAIGLDRGTNCFIANIVKCRPPGNRDPLPEESAACLPYLQRQIALLQPRAILTVGRISTQILVGRSVGIGELRGQRYTYRGIPLVATYHPSAVLRNQSLRKPVWEDLKLLRSVLGDG